MRRNYREMPRLLRLIEELRGSHTRLQPEIYFAYLETNNDMDNYREFLFREHHSLIPEPELRAILQETGRLAHELGYAVTLFESSLSAFLEAGGPTPPPLFLKERDLGALLRFLLGGGNPEVLRVARGNSAAIDRILEELRRNPDGWAKVLDRLANRDLLLLPQADVATEGFAEIEAAEGKNEISFRFQLPLSGTEIRITSGGVSHFHFVTGLDRETVQGKFVVHAPTTEAVSLDIEVSKHNEGANRFAPDERPLAYSVHCFEHQQRGLAVSRQ